MYGIGNYWMLCGYLNEKEIQKRGDICLCIADSWCYTHNIVINTPENSYTEIKANNKKRNMNKVPVMRVRGRERECWDMKGAPSSTQQSNDWGILMKKVPEAKERMFLKNPETIPGAHTGQAIVCKRSPHTDWTTYNSWAIGKNIQKTLLMDRGAWLLKCCTQYAGKFGKLSSSHRTGKGQFSFQSQRRAMPKNVQTTAQLRSSHMLAK